VKTQDDSISPDEAGEAIRGHDISEDGVDLSLIRWMLDLSPLERLEAAQGFADGIATIHRLGSDNAERTD